MRDNPYKKQSDLYQKELSSWVEKQKQDTYGGDTPQETWDMFVSALKKGDVDLASKYFVVEKQDEIRSDFSIAKDKGFIPTFLDDFSKIEGGTYYKNNNTRYQFYSIGTEGKWNGVVEFTYDLVLNKYNNKWKIESLQN